MHYLFIEWLESGTDEPSYWYLELDEQRYEHRRVVTFHDGRMQYSDALHQDDSIWLSSEPIPSFGELEANYEFRPREISMTEFEKIWVTAVSVGD